MSLYGVEAAVQGLKSGKKGKRSSSHAQRGGMLFTHRGFSGPAVLDLSHHKVMAMLRGTPQPGAQALLIECRLCASDITCRLFASCMTKL